MNDYSLPPRLQDSTIFLMVRVIKEGHKRANELFKDEKLRLMHYASAAYIAYHDGLSQKTLSELFLMDPSDIGTIVRDLEGAGYIVRKPNVKDRRQLDLTITPDGEEWLRKRDIGARDFDKQFLAPLSSGERAMWRELLIVMLGIQPKKTQSKL